ncbi:hypothetical protein [Acholeplasma hippikon]|nr:hypothetical protein [Acholeplasma hippikon]
MKLDFWFDFNCDSYESLKSFKEAFDSFKNKDEVTVSFRSINFNDSTKFHETYQFLKKKGLKLEVLLDLFCDYMHKVSINEAIKNISDKYQVSLDELVLNLETEKSKKVINNHMEHASLQKINQVPTITMSHGYKLVGVLSKEEIKETLIQMYEKDAGIEYCEENCER